MPLAKSAPQTTTETPPKTTTKEPVSIFSTEEKPHMEFYRYFNLNPIEVDDAQLNKVYKWANQESKSISDALRKTRSLESKLGVPKLGETRLTKLYNWIRISEQINDLRGSMKNEIGSITQKSKSEISRIKQGQLSELEKLNAQIEEKRNSLNKAIKYYKLNMNDQAGIIKSRYEKELKELNVMRAAFKGEK